MAKFNFNNFKESLSGLTKRAKNIKAKRSDSSRYSKGKRSATSDQSLGWRIAKYGFIGLLTFFVVCVISGGSLFAYYISSVPKLTENKLQSTSSSKIYDANGSLIADLGAEKRESASTDEIPTTLVNASTSIEDKRFFTHRGIDVYRIMGAAVNNLRRSSTQGGSTLDQQLIKLAYFSTNTSDQTLKRKSQEIVDSDAVANDEVAIGKTVVVQEVGTNDKDTYHIVGAAGADIFSGKISNESPIAQALIGKKVGDKVAIESPAGSYSVEILSVEKTA